MSIRSGSYAAALRLLRLLSPLLSRGDSKLAVGLRGRTGARETLAAWGRSRPDPGRPRVWLHAPSVGEGLQARAVLERLRARLPAVEAAYTFFSPSAETFSSSLRAGVASYLPWDVPSEMDALLADLSPALVGFTKTEVWPGLTAAAHARGIPVVLLAATLEPGAGRLRPGARQFLRPAFASLSRVFAVAADDAGRFECLGVPQERIEVTGDPGIDSAWTRAREAPARAPYLLPFRRDPRPTLVAGSTWEGDEEILIPAAAALASGKPRPRVIVAPHEPRPDHLAALERRARRAGLATVRLGEVERRGSDGGSDVVIVGRLGVLAHLYTVGTVAYVGGGFGRAGLHSVLEPAAAGLPVLVGPRYRTSRPARDLVALRAGEAVSGTTGLVDSLRRLFTGDDLREETAARASGYIERHRGAAEQTAEAIRRIIGP